MVVRVLALALLFVLTLIASHHGIHASRAQPPEADTAELNSSLGPVIEFYVQAMGAKEKGDYRGYIEGMEQALLILPGHSILMRHLAQGHSLAGRNADAIAWLDQTTQTGAWFDLDANPDFKPLFGSADFDRVRGATDANHAPDGKATPSFTVDDPLLIPEGVAYDPVSRSFFLSSIPKRKVIRIDADGNASDFTPADSDDLYCGLGMKVDAQRRHLWLVTAAFAGMRGYTEEMRGRATLSCFDLESGERLLHIEQGNDETEHNFNDLDLGADGRVYLTDSISGAIYTLSPGGDHLEIVLEPGVLNGPNGIALDDERGLLYIARYNLDIVALDLDSGELWSLAGPPSIALYGIDGLYLHDGGLIAIQNHPSLDRIARFGLSDDGRRVASERILLRRDPRFHEPTTGAIADGKLHFIANSQIETYMGMEDIAPGDDARVEGLDDVLILKVEL